MMNKQSHTLGWQVHEPGNVGFEHGHSALQLKPGEFSARNIEVAFNYIFNELRRISGISELTN